VCGRAVSHLLNKATIIPNVTPKCHLARRWMTSVQAPIRPLVMQQRARYWIFFIEQLGRRVKVLTQMSHNQLSGRKQPDATVGEKQTISSRRSGREMRLKLLSKLPDTRGLVVKAFSLSCFLIDSADQCHVSFWSNRPSPLPTFPV
jgi:hypothetical protein